MGAGDPAGDPPGLADDPESVFASMGNYIFTTKAMIEALQRDAEDENSVHDMGGSILPQLTDRGEAQLYDFSEHIYGRNRHRRKEAGKVVAVCVVLRRKMLHEAGLFDARFGLGNFEDDDICLRARLAGYKVTFARDVFIHHAGSKTFQALKVDYGRLMEENRLKFEAKWGAVAREFKPCHAGARKRAPDSTVAGEPVEAHTCNQGGHSEGADTAGGSAETGGAQIIALTDGGAEENVLAGLEVCGEPVNAVAVSVRGGEGEGRNGPGSIDSTGGSDSLADRIMHEVKALDSDTVFLLSPATVPPPGWKHTLEVHLSADGVGCALAVSNKGVGRDLVEPGYRKPGKPFLRFAAKRAKVWRGRAEDIDGGFPAAMAVRRQVLLECGLSDEFKTPAILLDLERRLADSGLRIVCAKGCYVHAADIACDETAREMEAVLELLAARSHLGNEKAAAALECLDRSLAAKADYTEAYYERGVVLSLMGRKPEAIADFERVLEIRPSDSRAANNLGCLHFEMGDFAEGERRFRSAVGIDPGNWEAAKNLADLLLSRGRADEAVEMYSSLIERHGGRPGVYTAMAEVFANLGDLESAGHLFEMALRAFPEDLAARKGLQAVQAALAGAGKDGRSQADEG